MSSATTYGAVSAGWRGARISHPLFTDNDDILGEDIEGLLLFVAGHRFRIELEEGVGLVNGALDGDAAGVADAGIAAGGGDGLEERDGFIGWHVVGARLLDLAEDGETAFGELGHVEAHLRVDEVVFGEQFAEGSEERRRGE